MEIKYNSKFGEVSIETDNLSVNEKIRYSNQVDADLFLSLTRLLKDIITDDKIKLSSSDYSEIKDLVDVINEKVYSEITKNIS